MPLLTRRAPARACVRVHRYYVKEKDVAAAAATCRQVYLALIAGGAEQEAFVWYDRAQHGGRTAIPSIAE